MKTRRWMNSSVAVLGLSVGLGLVVACGDEDDDDGASSGGTVAACMVLCDSVTGESTCTDAAEGMTQADCDAIAVTDCGGPAETVLFRAGCSCPGWGEADECTGVPDWAE